MVVAAPHREAEAAGAAILAAGGNAIEAAIAVAATLGVVYPHMTGLGGDAFWLISEPGKEPVGIQACGPAAQAATLSWYRSRGFTAIPARGPAAALTVAGAVGGWELALEVARAWGGDCRLADLFADARRLALQGISVSRSQAELTRSKWQELSVQPGFRETFAAAGPPPLGSVLVQSRVAETLETLASRGLDSFYRGELARTLAAELSQLGSPLVLDDLRAYRARFVEPLSVDLSIGKVWNLPPPTQGVSSLAILGIFDRLGIREAEGFDHLHGLVEATKTAFAYRNAVVGDPARMTAEPRDFLSAKSLAEAAAALDRNRATPWPRLANPGDTVWFGVIDAAGRAVSVIQSLYWEFGAGLVLPTSGLLWQNRGCSFTLGPGPNELGPGRLPFHTLNPALARLKDGRTLAYGTMGGEGQPQTQAAFLTRYAWLGQSLAQAISAPRWVLGRTWGDDSVSLRLEGRVDAVVAERLRAAGHPLEIVADFDDRMGHAGAVVAWPDGHCEAFHDPRADGAGLAVGDDPSPWLLRRSLASLAGFGLQPDGGTTRRLYDDAWNAARRWLEDSLRTQGFQTRSDRVGNLYGRCVGTGSDPRVILTGSHLDTVSHGGWYDGAYGVVASAVAVAELVRRHGPPHRTVDVVAFCEEEGSRFPLAYWGSGNLAGRWASAPGASAFAQTQFDAEGTSLFAAMLEAGFGKQEQADPQREDLAAFVELHIEQGIVLERGGEDIGIVSAIVGQQRWLVKVQGEANHAGTTPMGLRRDALAGAAEMMTLVEAEAQRHGDPLVATVGFIDLHPNTPNVVPGSASFTVDARHIDAAELTAFRQVLDKEFAEIAARRSLSLELLPRLSIAPAALSKALSERIRQSCEQRGLTHRDLPSGAGHDAQVLAELCPTTMIFIPSRAGVSHSPQEYSTHQALANGLAVLMDVLYDLAWKGTPL